MSIQISISNSIRGYRSVPGGVPVDPDAQAFITAAAITDPTQQAAINTLVVDLKGYSIWTKMKALYPFVGGTASSHKFNLKNPLDTDAAFRLTFSGGWTHSSMGALPNGTNAYADTFYNLSVNTTSSNVSAGFYSRVTGTSSGAQFGGIIPFNGLELLLNLSNATYWATNDNVGAGSGSFIADQRGFFILNKVSLTEKRFYKNGVQINSTTPDTNTAHNVKVYLGARNSNGTATLFDTRGHSFTYFGDTLTDTEAANFYTAVQAFQVALARNV
jgi:hypothetical protein